MKQSLTQQEIEKLRPYDQWLLASDLNCEETNLIHKINIGNLMEVIRKYHQLSIYTVNEVWCIQLFHLDESANDEITCSYENGNEELIDVLYLTIAWVYKRLWDQNH